MADEKTARPALGYAEAVGRMLDWAEGRRSWTNDVYFIEPPARRMELAAFLDTQEVSRWSTVAQALAAGDSLELAAELATKLDHFDRYAAAGGPEDHGYAGSPFQTEVKTLLERAHRVLGTPEEEQ